MTFMIYGANGYTGRIAAAQAAAEGDSPVLAGRREEALRALGEELDLPYRVASLSDPVGLAKALADVDLVLHCAGPFSATSKPMVDACLKTGTHYLDITGEIDVFEAVLGRHQEAVDAGVVLLPGAGFDVVPSDCLAACLAEAMPEATHLELAFAPKGGGMSPGTARTTVENLPRGGRVRKDGRIVVVPTAHRSKEIDYGPFRSWSMAIPWGDVSTAFHSTGIPNITVYTATPRQAVSAIKLSRLVAPLLSSGAVQRALKGAVDRWVEGPSEAEREAGRVYLWGRASDGAWRRVEGRLSVPEGYRHTVDAALAITERVLAGQVAPGAWTPSKALGARFVECLPGTSLDVPAPKGAKEVP